LNPRINELQAFPNCRFFFFERVKQHFASDWLPFLPFSVTLATYPVRAVAHCVPHARPIANQPGGWAEGFDVESLRLVGL